jgi:hypothetical protein
MDASPIETANLALKFALEAGVLAALAYFGATTGPTVVSVLLAVALPLIAALLWARFAAPKSEHRLRGRARLAFELGVFAAATLALAAAGAHVAAELFAALALVNTLLLRRHEQAHQPA